MKHLAWQTIGVKYHRNNGHVTIAISMKFARIITRKEKAGLIVLRRDKCTHSLIAAPPSPREIHLHAFPGEEWNRLHFVHDSLSLIRGYRSVFAWTEAYSRVLHQRPCRRRSARWIRELSRRGNGTPSVSPSRTISHSSPSWILA